MKLISDSNKITLKFGDGDESNLCRVKKKEMLVPHLLKIYFGLGWPSSVLEIVSVRKIFFLDLEIKEKAN